MTLDYQMPTIFPNMQVNSQLSALLVLLPDNGEYF